MNQEPRENFLYLLGALFLLTFVGPVMEVSFGTVGGLFAELSLSLTLVIALWSLRSTRTEFFTGVAMIGVNIACTVAWLWFDRPVAGIVAHLSGLVFLSHTALVGIHAILRPGPVSRNKVMGDLCVYVFIGVPWAAFCHLLHAYRPGSLSGIQPQSGQALSGRFLYFSFVTLTTLGYGDVLSLTLYAQTLTVIEMVIG